MVLISDKPETKETMDRSPPSPAQPSLSLPPPRPLYSQPSLYFRSSSSTSLLPPPALCSSVWQCLSPSPLPTPTAQFPCLSHGLVLKVSCHHSQPAVRRTWFPPPPSLASRQRWMAKDVILPLLPIYGVATQLWKWQPRSHNTASRELIFLSVNLGLELLSSPLTFFLFGFFSIFFCKIHFFL